ncbi:MAG: hypothetical protein KC561_17805, partial [Myxococcales bacterium]|nr:hypothetical protein [Myxococcales bacterium]
PEEMKKWGLPEEGARFVPDPVTEAGSTYQVGYEGYDDSGDLFRATVRSLEAAGAQPTCLDSEVTEISGEVSARSFFAQYTDGGISRVRVGWSSEDNGGYVSLELPSESGAEDYERAVRNNQCRPIVVIDPAE